MLCLIMLDNQWIIFYINIDLENVKLSKEEFINLLINNKIFSVLKYVIVEEKDNDKDFIVYIVMFSFYFIICFFFFYYKF